MMVLTLEGIPTPLSTCTRYFSNTWSVDFLFPLLLTEAHGCPGSAVAVERIFSSGRDTVSMWRSSLKAETICTLMLVKNQLCMMHNGVEELLGDDD